MNEKEKTLASEPMSEDDTPEGVRIVTLNPIKLGEDEVPLSYCKKDAESDFKPFLRLAEKE